MARVWSAQPVAAVGRAGGAQHGHPIVAERGQEVVGDAAAANEVGHFAQHRLAGRSAVAGVHAAEVVEVENRQPAPFGLGGFRARVQPGDARPTWSGSPVTPSRPVCSASRRSNSITRAPTRSRESNSPIDDRLGEKIVEARCYNVG